jgi:hypothetical protein
MKILFCIQASALHAARWINQFKDTGWDIHVVENMVPGWGICPEFECGTFHMPNLQPFRAGVQSVCTFRGNRQFGLRQKFGFPMPQAWLQAQHEDYLANWIQREKPDAIHLLGLGVNWVNQGMALLRTKKRLAGLPCPWIYSSWGTDLDYFGRDPANQAGVRAVLGEVDVFVSECERDYRLAKEFGFKGQFAGYFPAFGGTDIEEVNRYRMPGKSSEEKIILTEAREDREGGNGYACGGSTNGMSLKSIPAAEAYTPQPPLRSLRASVQKSFINSDNANPAKSSDRKLLLVKGRDHANGGDPIGRAMTVMRALWLCASDINQASCRVAIFQPDPTVTAEVHVLRAATGLNIEILPRLPYDGLMRLMGSARAVLAMTVNDGLPSILVEAMAFGALPIHSDLEPIREWVTDRKNGLLVGAEDVHATVEAIRRAVKDDELVDQAAEINGRLVAEKLEYGAVRQRAIEMYGRVVRRESAEQEGN